MKIQHLNIKFYCTPSSDFNLNDTVPLFHRWIQEKILGDELLIDVASYAHVPAGPGIMLIGHDAFYSLEYGSEERLGFLYNRRTAIVGDSNAERVATTMKEALKAKAVFADKSNTLEFANDEIRLSVNDALLSPNTPEAFELLQKDFTIGLSKALGLDEKQLKLSYEQGDLRQRMQIRVKWIT